VRAQLIVDEPRLLFRAASWPGGCGPLSSGVMTDEQFKTLVRELRIIQIGIAVMIVILVFIAGWLQP
jgi:hypothetical protein